MPLSSSSLDITTSSGNETRAAQITLTIPAMPEFVGTVRLAVLGIAGRMSFTYDEVEDIRLAVGEACTNAIARIAETDLANHNITIRATVEPASLTIEVDDDIPVIPTAPKSLAQTLEESESPDFGTLLMEILVDEVTSASKPNGSHLRLMKRVETPLHNGTGTETNQ